MPRKCPLLTAHQCKGKNTIITHHGTQQHLNRGSITQNKAAGHNLPSQWPAEEAQPLPNQKQSPVTTVYSSSFRYQETTREDKEVISVWKSRHAHSLIWFSHTANVLNYRIMPIRMFNSVNYTVLKVGMMAHPYNSSTLENWGKRMESLCSAWAI